MLTHVACVQTGDKFWHIAISQSFGIVGFIIASSAFRFLSPSKRS